MPIDEKDLASIKTMMVEMLASHANDMKTQYSSDVQSAITRRLDGFSKKLTPEEPKVPDEEKSLKEQLKELRAERDRERQASQEEKVINHILKYAQASKYKHPEDAVTLLKNKFQYKDGQVVSLDEYGEPIKTEDIFKSLKKERPAYFEAEDRQGTGKPRDYSSGSRPFSSTAGQDLPEQGDTSTFQVKLKANGNADMERILGRRDGEE